MTTPLRTLSLSGLLLASLLGACQVLPASVGAGAAQGVRVVGQVVPSPSGLGAPSFGLLDAPTTPLEHAITVAKVRWVGLFLKRGSEAEVDLGRLPGVSTPVELNQLRGATEYQLRLEAYDLDEVRLDDASSGSVTTFSTGNTLLMTGLSFALKLKDRDYLGSGVPYISPSAASPGLLPHPDGEGVASQSAQGVLP